MHFVRVAFLFSDLVRCCCFFFSHSRLFENKNRSDIILNGRKNSVFLLKCKMQLRFDFSHEFFIRMDGLFIVKHLNQYISTNLKCLDYSYYRKIICLFVGCLDHLFVFFSSFHFRQCTFILNKRCFDIRIFRQKSNTIHSHIDEIFDIFIENFHSIRNIK